MDHIYWIYQPLSLGLWAPVVSKGSPHPGSGEQGWQPNVQGQPPTWRIEIPLLGGGRTFDTIWESRDGSVHHPPQHPTSTIVLLGKPGKSSTALIHPGWENFSMPSCCFVSFLPCWREWGWKSLYSSWLLWTAIWHCGRQRWPKGGESAFNRPFPLWLPRWDSKNWLFLDIQTIQTAGAKKLPVTSRSGRDFSAGASKGDPLLCAVGSMLSFLQCLLGGGLCHATIKVMQKPFLLSWGFWWRTHL